MNENINLCEILKDCPNGWKFYSGIHGDVRFITLLGLNKILFGFKDGKHYFDIALPSDGKLYKNGECIVFPSKDQRDWSKFTAPWYNNEESIKPKFKVGDKIRHKEINVYEISKVYDNSYEIVGFNWGIYMKYQDQYELVSNKFDPKTLKPFDKVLVRNNDNHKWTCDLFSDIIVGGKCLYHCLGSYYRYCIPYNDETKHLVGTTDEAPEYYRYWED